MSARDSTAVRADELASRRTPRLFIVFALPRRHLSRCIRLLMVGYRAFPVASPRVSNSLPQYITSAPPLPVFRDRLKTRLFKRYRCTENNPQEITPPGDYTPKL